MKTLGFLISCRWMLLILVGRIFSWDWVAVPPLLSPSPSPSFILFYFLLRQAGSYSGTQAAPKLILKPRLSLNSWHLSCLSLQSAGVSHQTLLERHSPVLSAASYSAQVRSWFLAELPSAGFAEVSSRGRGPGLEAASLAFPSYHSATCFSLDSLPAFFL